MMFGCNMDWLLKEHLKRIVFLSARKMMLVIFSCFEVNIEIGLQNMFSIFLIKFFFLLN